MRYVKILLGYVLIQCICIRALSQGVEPTAADTASVNKQLAEVESLLAADPPKALTTAFSAQNAAKQIGYQQGEAKAYKLIGTHFYFKGDMVNAINYWNSSLQILRNLKDPLGQAKIMGNIGAAYVYQEDDVKALEYHLASLKIAEEQNDKTLIFKQLNNIAGVYFTKTGTWDKAYDYLSRVLVMSKELPVDSNNLGGVYGNIAAIYFNRGQLKEAERDFRKALALLGEENINTPFSLNGLGKLALKEGKADEAIRLHTRALEVAQKVNRPLSIPAYTGLAEAYMAKGNTAKAFENYHMAEKVADETNGLTEKKDVFEKMALAYASMNQYNNAFEYQMKLDKIKDALYDEKIRKKVGLLQFDFELQKKQGEVDLLTKDKALKEAELNRQRAIKWAFTVGFTLVFFIAFIIYRNYRAKVRINKILDKQKEQIEHLLLNILPAEVATELQDSGHATPRFYENVSVLFTDFKSFTTIADKMSPQDLVDELNECFMAFDDIIESFNLEKIKTIGDSYMCAGGIPTPHAGHHINIIRAGMAIQQWVIKNNEERKLKGLVPWDIRVGVHAGPLVAGVVGKKKYAYDIWGSTVNVASRMESNGEPGQVNISANLYEMVKDHFACRYRGKIYAKNVGEIDMYFVEHEIENGQPVPPTAVEKVAGQTDTKLDVETLYN